MSIKRFVFTELFALTFLLNGIHWACSDERVPLGGCIAIIATTALVSALLAIGAYARYKNKQEV